MKRATRERSMPLVSRPAWASRAWSTRPRHASGRAPRAHAAARGFETMVAMRARVENSAQREDDVHAIVWVVAPLARWLRDDFLPQVRHLAGECRRQRLGGDRWN